MQQGGQNFIGNMPMSERQSAYSQMMSGRNSGVLDQALADREATAFRSRLQSINQPSGQIDLRFLNQGNR
jgi:hypothetical protein